MLSFLLSLFDGDIILLFITGKQSRLHQTFIHGEKLDCQKWMDDWLACLRYQKSKNPDDLVSWLGVEQ